MTTEAPPLQKLRPTEEAFAQSVAGGMAQSEAYRLHYPLSRKWKPDSVWVAASKVAAAPHVRARIAELKAEASNAAVFTLADHLRNLGLISERALDAKDYNAAARAEEARGKAAGFYKQRVELTGKDGGPIESRQTRDLTDAELDAELRAHGIDPDTVKPRPPSATH